ncbi:GNAT family N-acetyltransferase [Muriicola sp. E247]|uniref:GNAT family N-acetyltransferase n=1 Tax=Muriicola sp. E247 TaxID=3242730 RepID=UPI003526BDA8
MIEVIREKDTWNELVNSCQYSDSYHTYDYHHATLVEGEEPILIHYTEKGNSILLPLLIRDIEFSKYKDATSVYGYGGPIASEAFEYFDLKLFQKELRACFIELNLLTVFLRLNPFIPSQDIFLHQLGVIETIGNILFIDVKESIDEQIKGYHRRLRTYVNTFRNIYLVKKASTPSEIESFIEAYYQTMNRVNAKKEYFFSKTYFNELIKSSQFETEVLLAICRKTDEVAGGAMFLKKEGIIQYHLSGTNNSFLNSNPLKLLIDEMRIIGTQENYNFFNLGGGVGAKEDSLFYFKSGFSNHTLPFKVWKYIINQKKYDELVSQRNVIANSKYNSSFFPSYRFNQF